MCVSRFTGEVSSLVWEICGVSSNMRGCVIVWWGGVLGDLVLILESLVDGAVLYPAPSHLMHGCRCCDV